MFITFDQQGEISNKKRRPVFFLDKVYYQKSLYFKPIHFLHNNILSTQCYFFSVPKYQHHATPKTPNFLKGISPNSLISFLYIFRLKIAQCDKYNSYRFHFFLVKILSSTYFIFFFSSGSISFNCCHSKATLSKCSRGMDNG